MHAIGAEPRRRAERLRSWIGKPVTLKNQYKQIQSGTLIALAHLKELPDYYTRLAKMEAEAEGTSSS